MRPFGLDSLPSGRRLERAADIADMDVIEEQDLPTPARRR
jgi:hypothetical protein